MSRIRSKDTSIELTLRSALWRSGFRFRKHFPIIGSPDVAFPRHKIAVFCDSSFWHGRNWIEKRRRLKTNRDYWIAKIERNIARDRRVDAALAELGWMVLRFWDEDIVRKTTVCVDSVARALQEHTVAARRPSGRIGL
jgi:DNA mismatch endonuclease (patch repair protein)